MSIATSLTTKQAKGNIPLHALSAKDYSAWLKSQPAHVKSWIKAAAFEGKTGQYIRIPAKDGAIAQIVTILSEPVSQWDIAALPGLLKEGRYELHSAMDESVTAKLALGWALGCQRHTLYKKDEEPTATLCLSNKTNTKSIIETALILAQARTLITTPAEDLGPVELAEAVKNLAAKYKATFKQIAGDQLKKQGFEATHRVGRASPRAPRLIEMNWGHKKHPKVTLIGKGVCFDTGGLDIKPSGGMYLMRKDMGGAAVALSVAAMVMSAKLPIQLQLIIPCVDNAIDGNAFRPSDIIKMPNGKTVEVGNTDAEGRLILADALCAASKGKPDLIIDFATLTGAARSAVGTEISAFFCDNDELAQKLYEAGCATEDHLWRMPLFKSYQNMLKSPFADITSCPASPYAGAITAALFLQEFVDKATPWIHLDFMAWNTNAKPGRPEGGEAMAARAVTLFLEKRFTRT
ncbi:MAG: leucyl aminopeptidase family protein [Proteobacteria bacterium]|jgi:leucyl aminopeptidase|nr:leucyl aminopeptidase family protein [Alphaproteobacteria bacterium]NCC02537.1 leucyl aminopeptidase family protein [Pseudomonadota bacterium]